MLTGLFSPVHILVVAVVALVVLGPAEAVGAVRALGRAVGEFERWRAANPLEQLLEPDLAHEEAGDPDVSVVAQGEFT